MGESEESVWDPTTFTQNRARFEEHGLYRAFFEESVAAAMLKEVGARHWVRPKTIGTDKGYDHRNFLREIEEDFGIKPHVATRAGRIKGGDAEG